MEIYIFIVTWLVGCLPLTLAKQSEFGVFEAILIEQPECSKARVRFNINRWAERDTEQLNQTQNKLIDKEKMATLGGRVASIR